MLRKKLKLKQSMLKKQFQKSPFDFNVWESIVLASGIESETEWADLSKSAIQEFINQLTKASFQVNGRSF
jgi:predicted flavoprotein YhiN